MLDEYPKQIELQDGTKCELRPMKMSDHDALYRYFISLPERIRKYLRNDVTNRILIEQWCRKLDYDKLLPILALEDGKIIGNASLLRVGNGAINHIGEIRITFDIEFHKQGLASVLVDEVCDLARQVGYEKLMVKIVSSRELVIKLFEEKEFTQIATLKNYVKNIYDNEYRNIIIMEKSFKEF